MTRFLAHHPTRLVQADDPVLLVIGAHQPTRYRAVQIAYVTCLFTTLCWAWSVALPCLARDTSRVRRVTLSRYPDPATRTQLCVVIGETHHPAVAPAVRRPT